MKRQQRSYTPLMISGTPVERVSSFKYLGVNISEDLSWTAHIQTQVKKARQSVPSATAEKFRVSPAILKTFYSGAIESVMTQFISVWYGNAIPQTLKSEPQSSAESCALSWVHLRVCSHLSAGYLPQTLQKQSCKNHQKPKSPWQPSLILLPSGKRFRSMMAKTERFRWSFFLRPSVS